MEEVPLAPAAILRDAVRAIESSRRRTAVVVDQDGHLLGTITDGDIRRLLLSGGNLESNVTKAMNTNPIIAPEGSSQGALQKKMNSANILCIPLINSKGLYVSLIHASDLFQDGGHKSESNFFAGVIMAGGLGSRLAPLTNNLPKPMVDIAGVPLLERLLIQLRDMGITKAFVAVNHLAHVIEDHIEDGSRLGMDVRYLREEERLGTAGALSLLPEKPDGPIVVMNGDILTTSDFNALYSFHLDQNAAITAAAIDYRIDIPYGVFVADGAVVKGLVEKPSQKFLCNAGIYAVSPEILEMIPQSFYNMTDLIDACLNSDRNVAVFPLHEYWSDIGTPGDLEKARTAFKEFNK
ncbi:MAG: nucleotidyltransferase family protein [Alphaproteobacteria bacterium]|nr:nucleotidyltransferase family protein [Alphaproteobacteria bacterium]